MGGERWERGEKREGWVGEERNGEREKERRSKNVKF